MTNFRKKLIDYFYYFKENMTINLLLIFMTTLSATTLSYSLYYDSKVLAYAFIIEAALTLLLLPIQFTEIKSIKGNILKLCKDLLKLLITTIVVLVVAVFLMNICMLASGVTMTNNLSVTRFSLNLSFILALYIGVEGLSLFLSIFIILVYLLFKKMNIWKSIYYSRKFIRKRIFSHIFTSIAFMFLSSPILRIGTLITKPVFLNLFFISSYLIILGNFVIFDIKSNIDYVDKKIKEDKERKKSKPSFFKEMKDFYLSEREAITKQLILNKERKKRKDENNFNLSSKNDSIPTNKTNKRKSKNKKNNKGGKK